MNAPLHDRLGRPLEALRISVTDRCNLRCTYCMPKAAFAHHAFLGQDDLLTFDEIERLARVFIRRGVRKIRLTGGEPLLRPHLEDLIARLAALPELTELALSTNGLLLAQKAEALRAAGLQRINLSLDAIDDGVFGAINGMGRPAAPVLQGLDAALEAGLHVKVNMVVERGVNEAQILPMARHFASRDVPLRFIEFMDVGNTNGWTPKLVVSGAEIRAILAAEFELEPEKSQASDTSQNYRCRRTGARFGFIDSVTHPFCRGCNRLRLSADGRVFTCLFSQHGHDLRQLLRDGASDDGLARHISEIWLAREDRYSELRSKIHLEEPKVEMSYIGG
ncbi:MAG TPA: GTP 3',8-cyclase MoaA [Candidatus Methylacidiphilales bacterium]|jgi:cyclic pyranopterin phosphate synthase|nr:GTP 3',8-cyclase MoaA [Candidatus Methylacidiphilales bacterium]